MAICRMLAYWIIANLRIDMGKKFETGEMFYILQTDLLSYKEELRTAQKNSHYQAIGKTLKRLLKIW